MKINATLPRRDLLKLSAAGLLSGVSVPWFESLAAKAAVKRPRGKACILLWMDGGPSQQHTFDPKPGGEFKSVSTNVTGIQIVEQLPQLSQCMDDMAIPPLDEDGDQQPLRRQIPHSHRLPPCDGFRASRHRLHRLFADRPSQ